MKYRLYVYTLVLFTPFIMSSCCLLESFHQESKIETWTLLLFFYITTIIAALLELTERMGAPEIKDFYLDGKRHTYSTGNFFEPNPKEGVNLSCGAFSLYIAGVIGYFLFDIVENTNLLIKLLYFIACVALAVFIWKKAKMLVNIIRIISYIFVFSDILIGIGKMLWDTK